MKSLRPLFSCLALMVGVMCMSSVSTAALMSVPQHHDDSTLDGFGLDSPDQVLEEVAVLAPDKAPSSDVGTLKLQMYGVPVGLTSQWTSEVCFDMLAFTPASAESYLPGVPNSELHDSIKRGFLWSKDLE